MKKKEGVQKPSIKQYLAKYKGWIFLYIFLIVLTGVLDFILVLSFARILELVTVYKLHDAIITCFFVVGLLIVGRLIGFLANYIYFKYSNKIMSELNLDLAKQAFKLDTKTFSDHSTGTFVQRIVDDPATMIDSLSTILEYIMAITTSLAVLIYIFTLSVWVALIFAMLILISGVIEYFRIKKRRKNMWVVRNKKDKINSLTTEIIRSEKDVKSMGLEDQLGSVSKSSYDDYRKQRYKLDITEGIFWTTRGIIIQVGVILTIALSIFLVDRGLMTIAAFMIVFSNRTSLWNVINYIGSLINTFISIKICNKRMFSLFDEEEFVTEKFGTTSIENVVGEIEFADVSYTFKEWDYGNSSDDEPNKESKKEKKKGKQSEKQLVSENKIFDKLSFKIQPNTTVAFVGKSGSGKSTILNLMSKMYEADEGQVLIDGHDIKTFDKKTLRSVISLVNQFPYIFDMSIKDNLLLAKPDATDEEVISAIKNASLYEFVETLPKGIDTKVGESGIKLSGGQKQRLAIARALLRNSSIIIFDESTSSLDNFAQEEVRKSIDALKGNSTIVIVAHRLSTIKNADRIFFLDAGKIVDDGTFEELFERNDKFKAMFLAENI